MTFAIERRHCKKCIPWPWSTFRMSKIRIETFTQRRTLNQVCRVRVLRYSGSLPETLARNTLTHSSKRPRKCNEFEFNCDEGGIRRQTNRQLTRHKRAQHLKIVLHDNSFKSSTPLHCLWWRCEGAYRLTLVTHSKGHGQSHFDGKKNSKTESRCVSPFASDHAALNCKWSLNSSHRFVSSCTALALELILFTFSCLLS